MKYKRSEHNWKLIGINSSSSEYWIITAQVLDFTLLGVTSCARINKPWPSSVFCKDFILHLVAGGICILQNSSDWHSFFLQTFFPLFFFLQQSWNQNHLKYCRWPHPVPLMPLLGQQHVCCQQLHTVSCKCVHPRWSIHTQYCTQNHRVLSSCVGGS